MKKFFTIFFVTLGVIFFGLLLYAAYFWIADPWGIKPFIMNSGVQDRAEMPSPENTSASKSDDAVTETGSSTPTSGGTVEQNPNLSTGQENALEAIGIDPGSLPSTITPAQEACFVAKLGAARVAEVQAGATPTAAEFFSAKGCLSL